MNNNELDVYRYRLDFAKVENYIDIHKIIMRDLDFPDYYGGNMGALWDCLTDMLCDISYIEIYNIENIKKFKNYDEQLLKILTECKHAFDNKFSDRFFVTIYYKEGTKKEIE